jgi:LysR family tcuABC transcriptional regulator
VELRQLRCFIAVVEHGTMGKAALELGVGTSAVSQQISRLEGELSTRLLQRTDRGVVLTEAGAAFWRQAQLGLRHLDYAVVAAGQARLSGCVNVGFPPSAGSVLGMPFMFAMRERYPDVKVCIAEAMTGHLEAMLSAHQIDIAVMFREVPARKWSALRLLDERLFFIAPSGMAGMPVGESTSIEMIKDCPLVLPTRGHGLRILTMECFRAAGIEPRISAEVDGLAILMEAVREGFGCTIQPGAALIRLDSAHYQSIALSDPKATRPALLLSLSDDDLSPAGLAARVVLTDVMRTLVRENRWPGATLYNA